MVQNAPSAEQVKLLGGVRAKTLFQLRRPVGISRSQGAGGCIHVGRSHASLDRSGRSESLDRRSSHLSPDTDDWHDAERPEIRVGKEALVYGSKTACPRNLTRRGLFDPDLPL